MNANELAAVSANTVEKIVKTLLHIQENEAFFVPDTG
jgi:hypothetical protein